MALTSGTKLGPYEIQSPLGAGGMGEVYRARDTRLGRDVAIKVLPPHLSSNPEIKQRFKREARSISSLNHPRICTLYDLGHQDETDYLVMEFLEGETLADRLRKGPLPPQQVLEYGIEIGEGLERAHRAGVVHRDLKPGNIMLTKSGVKLMDFGLAKAITAVAPPSSGLSMTQSTPAHAHPLTTQGTIVGTFQYMSPEQIEGKEADARSDIFAFGAVLYEMVTGKHAFEGKSQLNVASAILERDPAPINVARQGISRALDRTIAMCLAKDPEQRWSTAHDVVLQLTLIANSEADLSRPVVRGLPGRAAFAIALLALLLGAGIVGLVGRWTRPSLEPRPAIRFTIAFPKEAPLALPNPSPEFAIAPNGSAIAYVAIRRTLDESSVSLGTVEGSTRANEGGWSASSEAVKALYIRRMDQFAPERVPGGEDAISPFFSPDSLWLGWFSHGTMKKMPVGVGSPITICEVDSVYIGGAHWASDGFIYFAPGDLMPVSASGGKPDVVVSADATRDVDYQSPQLLPGGKAVLLTRKPLNITSYDDAVIVAYRLDAHETVTLVEGGTAGMYLSSGHLLYARGGSVFAMPFDAAKLKVLGPAVEVLRGGMLHQANGFATLAVSSNGVLAYAPGGPIHLDNDQLVAITRAGAVSVLSPSPHFYAEPATAPDGQSLAVTIHAANDDIWLLNHARHCLA